LKHGIGWTSDRALENKTHHLEGIQTERVRGSSEVKLRQLGFKPQPVEPPPGFDHSPQDLTEHPSPSRAASKQAVTTPEAWLA
jgi:hypothetical protein